MSFMVVINGPVASAGSILSLCKNSGINVPKKEAYNMTINSEMETDSVRFMLP
jgi:hypothetical protein